jgi:hypothetical protein
MFDFYNYNHFVQISPSTIDIEFKKKYFLFYVLKCVKICKGSCEGEIMWFRIDYGSHSTLKTN